MSKDNYRHDIERGLAHRRRVLGDAWVDRALANATQFNVDFQDFITRFAWNEIWGRPGLDESTRRIIVLSITIALGRWEEFEIHVRAALQSDALTLDELKEVLIQSAVYAGVPAANTAFAHAQKIMRELGDVTADAFAHADLFEVAHPGAGRSGRTADKPALHYTVREPRQPSATTQTIVLSHALGCDLSMWDELATTIAATHRVIAYDHRGHGDSDTPPGDYTLAQLADDAARFINAVAREPVVWIGLSMGGMVGQEIALRHPALVKALVTANSSGGYGPDAKPMWQQRIESVRKGGMQAIADTVLGRYFSEAFRAAAPATVARFRRRLLATDSDGYIGCCHAVMNVDTLPRLSQISVPTLVIAGALDQGAPVTMSQAIADRIGGARLVVLPDASHLSVIEQPAAFSATLNEFLNVVQP